MRIVSQDRQLSIDFANCEIRAQGSVIYRRIDGHSEVLGVYSTVERAAEVFEDIHRAYAPVYSISGNFSEEEIRKMLVKSPNIVANNIIGVSNAQFVTTYSDYVYYMPER
ncbi:MAG: hypothetical protein IJ833_02570 [Lachnospiraceae bacterium]|nr:hypothetical protein [Lachnospiraceae bacterium]